MAESVGVLTIRKGKEDFSYSVSNIEHFADIYIFICPGLNDNNKVAIIRQPREDNWKLLIANDSGSYHSIPYKILGFNYTKKIVVIGE